MGHGQGHSESRSSKTVWEAQLEGVRSLAIDEIAIAKGHRYLTVVMDLDSGAVVFVGDTKGHEALIPFWKLLGRYKDNIEAVASDMGQAYLFAIRENLPNAVHVLDHFHVVKSFNDKLSDLRRDLYREAVSGLQKDVLKGTRWLLLKNPENLDASKNEMARLEEALQLNKPLATAYYLKEELRGFWNKASKATADKAILAYYDYPISTGPLEGMNNKIKTMKRQAYGFRDIEFFKLRIKSLHKTKYALVG